MIVAHRQENGRGPRLLNDQVERHDETVRPVTAVSSGLG
jgi:hypothetical protein